MNIGGAEGDDVAASGGVQQATKRRSLFSGPGDRGTRSNFPLPCRAS